MTETIALIPGRIGIRVYGVPVPQGSMVAFIDKATHRARLKSSNEKTLKAWRKMVQFAAEDQCRYHDTITGPVKVWLRFTFDRPASHHRTGRNAHLLKDTAPEYPVGRGHGDSDKLERAVFDSLTAAHVWADDSLVVDHRTRKFYVDGHELALDRPGVDIILEPLTRQEVLL